MSLKEYFLNHIYLLIAFSHYLDEDTIRENKIMFTANVEVETLLQCYMK